MGQGIEDWPGWVIEAMTGQGVRAGHPLWIDAWPGWVRDTGLGME